MAGKMIGCWERFHGLIFVGRALYFLILSKLSDSINISRGLVEMKLPKQCPNADTMILTHCAGGERASLTAQTLKQMGYTRVYAITAPYDEIKKTFG